MHSWFETFSSLVVLYDGRPSECSVQSAVSKGRVQSAECSVQRQSAECCTKEIIIVQAYENYVGQ